MSTMGIQMLLKSLGIDPKMIEAKFEEAKILLDQQIKQFDAQLKSIQASVDALNDGLSHMAAQQNAMHSMMEKIAHENSGERAAGYGAASGPDAFAAVNGAATDSTD